MLSKNLTFLFSAFLMGLLALAACSPVEPAAPVVESLDGSSWNLVGFGAPDNLSPLVSGTEITIDFAGDQVSGSDGCNQYNGPLSLNGTSIRMGAEGFVTTRRACGQEVMQQENTYLEMLKNVQTYSIENEYLVLHTPDSALTFSKAPALSLEGTEWHLSGIVEGEVMVGSSIDNGITLQFVNGQIGGNSGCNSYSANYTLDGEKLSLGEITSTLMACDEAVNQRETAFLTALGKVVGYQLDRSSLTLLDGNGNELMSFATDQSGL